MLISFNEMSPQSRVWIYQADKPFSEESKKILESRINNFLSGWDSHGTPLKTSWKLFYDLFLVIAVDEKHYAASGCSIDKSVRFIQELENELHISLLEKNTVAVLVNSNIELFKLPELKKYILEGKIKPQSIIFNNLVSTLDELNNNWQLPAEATWVSRYFNK